MRTSAKRIMSLLFNFLLFFVSQAVWSFPQTYHFVRNLNLQYNRSLHHDTIRRHELTNRIYLYLLCPHRAVPDSCHFLCNTDILVEFSCLIRRRCLTFPVMLFSRYRWADIRVVPLFLLLPPDTVTTADFENQMPGKM